MGMGKCEFEVEMISPQDGELTKFFSLFLYETLRLLKFFMNSHWNFPSDFWDAPRGIFGGILLFQFATKGNAYQLLRSRL